MIPGLDGLRAIAFLLVFFLHLDVFWVGWMGVTLFFVLSGFLITGILLQMKKTLAPRDYFIKFYGRRFLRIFPLYYLYLLLIALLTTWLISIAYQRQSMQIFWDQISYAILYVYDFFFGSAAFQHSKFLDHMWSLSVEEQFYIIWPLLILLVPERGLKKLFVGTIILGPVFRLLFFFVHMTGAFPFLADSPSIAVYPLPFSHMDAFAFGAYISLYPIPKAKQQFFLLAAWLPLLGYATQFLANGEIGPLSSFGYLPFLSDAYKFIWAYSPLNYLCALVVYGVAREGWITNMLEWRPLRYLGRISYGLYVYHLPVIWFSGRIADLGVSPPFLKPLTALIALLGTILTASLSFHFIERPITNLKERFFPLHLSEKVERSVVLAVEQTPQS